MKLTRKSLILTIFLLPAVAAAADLSEPEAYSLFNQANETFRQANASTDEPQQEKLYEKTILSYEKLINLGRINNAKLYYNLANSYLLKRDVGRAILNYRRAEKLDNSNANIKKNLTFARAQRIDKIKVKTEKRVLQTLFFWHYDFSMETKFITCCICFAIVCISLTIMIWFGKRTALTVTATIAAVLMLCFLLSVAMESYDRTKRVCGVITAKEVIARQGDGKNYPESFTEPLHAGTEFDLLEQRSGWLHIILPDESEGWIPETTADSI